ARAGRQTGERTVQLTILIVALLSFLILMAMLNTMMANIERMCGRMENLLDTPLGRVDRETDNVSLRIEVDTHEVREIIEEHTGGPMGMDTATQKINAILAKLEEDAQVTVDGLVLDGVSYVDGSKPIKSVRIETHPIRSDWNC